MAATTESLQLECSADSCSAAAASICSRCHLIAYCSRACQRTDWLKHKTDCNHEMSKAHWRPSWHREDRVPSFINRTIHQGSSSILRPRHGRKAQKYLWGTVPALDVLNLKKNEGDRYAENLSICFAASEDLRDAIMTVNSLPCTFNGKLRMLINDQDDQKSIRNVLIILILGQFDTETGAEAAIHIWYSARIKSAHWAMITASVCPIVEEILFNPPDPAENTVLSKEIKMHNGIVKVILYRKQWQRLFEYLKSSPNIEQTEGNRKAVVLKPETMDDRHKHLFKWQVHLHQRLSCQKFRERGVLLPFGRTEDGFSQANPTLFHSHNLNWSQMDDADPLGGWNRQQINMNTYNDSLSIIPNDLYGNLYFFLLQTLKTFQSKLKAHSITFELISMRPQSLQRTLNLGAEFDRICIADLVDSCHLGVERSMAFAKPLLKLSNPKSTVISLFLNAIPIVATHHAFDDSISRFQLASMFSQLESRTLPPLDPIMIRLGSASERFYPLERYFAEYTNERVPHNPDDTFGLRMKNNNTIVDKWPFMMKRRWGEPGAQDEFDELFQTTFAGSETYVEWYFKPS